MKKEAEEKMEETNIQDRKEIIDFDSFVIPGGRSIEEIDDYMRELREDRCITLDELE